MKRGEAGVVTALLVFLAGAVLIAATDPPEPVQGQLSGEIAEISVYDQLKQAIRPYHFGNVPRESFRADTTVWVVDLDYNMYTVPQTDLHVTRILRELGFTDIEAGERASGGIVFRAVFPNGQPLEINFTRP